MSFYPWTVPTANDPAVPPGVCIFCSVRPAPDAPCTYGGKHEVFSPVVTAAPQAKRPDAKLCTKCGLHPKNPASATNGCTHEYP